MAISALFPRTKRQLLLACGLFSLFMLAAALVAQYGFGLHPCELCLYQRYPYAAVALVALAGWRFARSGRVLALLLALVAVLFAVDAGIAFYHTGVEYGWFKGPDACSSGGGSGQTLEEMRAAIMNAPLVSCSQAMAYIFGLSMAAWNAMAAAVAAISTLVWMRRVP